MGQHPETTKLIDEANIQDLEGSRWIGLKIR